jgi:hypothetical protein
MELAVCFGLMNMLEKGMETQVKRKKCKVDLEKKDIGSLHSYAMSDSAKLDECMESRLAKAKGPLKHRGQVGFDYKTGNGVVAVDGQNQSQADIAREKRVAQLFANHKPLPMPYVDACDAQNVKKKKSGKGSDCSTRKVRLEDYKTNNGLKAVLTCATEADAKMFQDLDNLKSRSQPLPMPNFRT